MFCFYKYNLTSVSNDNTAKNVEISGTATQIGKTLKDNNLINYETYGTIELTDEGENLAKKILEAYDIVYIFLKDVLNINSKEAQQQAEQIKQSITDNTLNHLAKYVHKVLGLTNLDCGYDINKEKCRACARRKVNKNEKIVNN